ncbi:MAG: phosphoglycerate dehydrogenase [Candidatus Sericytochromatia bacterium]
MEKILILDGVDKTAIDILKNDFETDVRNTIAEDELKEIIKNYSALIVRSQTKVTKEIIELSNLKIIGRAGVGVDNIDVDSATRKGIIVVNSPDGNTIAAAEQTLALLMSVARHIPQANQSLKNNEWKRKEYTGVELYNKTIGIIGLGRIGSHVAKVCKALGMNLIGFDPFISKARAEELGLEICELEKIYQQADFITIHVPLNHETKNLINIDTMKRMKSSVRIINCSRGGIINENDLAYALENNIIAGAAIDVFEKEPLKDSPLQKIQDKLIITPHLGASTQEAQINVAIDVAEQIKSYLKGEGVKNAVNYPSSSGLKKELKPFVDLAGKIATFLGQLSSSSLKSLEIQYQGQLTNENTKPISLVIIKNVLYQMLGDTVNYVNAPLVAKDRNISIKEINSTEECNYKSKLTIKAIFEDTERAISGTIFNDDEEKIIQVDNYKINFNPEGKYLVTINTDKPGMVGKIGTILGQNNINIANMFLSRKEKSAMMLLNIDDEVSDNVLSDLKAMEGIIDIKYVSF